MAIFAAAFGYVSWLLVAWLVDGQPLGQAVRRAVYGAMWASAGYAASWLTSVLLGL